ncbi:prenyltransferase [Hydrogenovibrio kuenenii]|uniref:prenyltransferase n=1 Tax=Hydrogenovibrio kuenenii TaxID=63658 RepID=UPI0004653335|nr:prenyltransferase [Hydrogenovibrio kuenenii]
MNDTSLKLKTVFMTMRPPFLVLTLSIMLLLLAIAVQEAGLRIFHFSFGLFVLVFIGALAAHISVNMLNEYEDYQSGLDDLTDRTPFSGGSGALQTDAGAQEWVAAIAYTLIGLIISLGVYFIYLRGWGLLPIGLLGVFVILTYTSLLTRFPWLCFAASGLGFGPLIMLGGYYVLFGEFSWQVAFVSLIPFLLVNNLLLINQLPDKDADERIGRFNLWHQYGVSFGLKLFVLQGVLTFVVLSALIATGVLPVAASLGFLLLLLFAPIVLKVKYLLSTKNDSSEEQLMTNVSATWRDQLNTVMAMNVGVTILLPIAIAVGVYVSLI